MKKIVLFLYVLGFATGPTFLDARPAAVEYDDYDEDYDDDDYYDEDYIDPTDLNAIHNNINENQRQLLQEKDAMLSKSEIEISKLKQQLTQIQLELQRLLLAL